MKKRTLFSAILAIVLILGCIFVLTGCPKKTAETAAAAPAGEIDPLLIGNWEFVDGEFVYFFWESKHIEFKADGTAINHEEEPEDGVGTWSITDEGQLEVVVAVIDYEGGFELVYEFTYVLENDMLIITDEVDDVATFRKK